MANYDVIITGAKAYHSPLIDAKTRMALALYAKALVFLSTTDYTTAAGQKLLTASAVKAFAGISPQELLHNVTPVDVAIWFKTAANVGGAVQVSAEASLNAKLAAIPYWLNLDVGSLAKSNLFALGLADGVLT